MRSAVLMIALWLPALTDEVVSRAELEARARATSERIAELKQEIETNQRAIQESQRIIAEMKGQLTVWGIVLAALSSTGVVTTLIKAGHRHDHESKGDKDER